MALVSVSVMGDTRFSGYDWLAAQGLPIIWVASEARGRDPRYYPPEYSYTLPPSFTASDLRKLLFELLGVLDQVKRAAPRREQPLIAVSAPMRELLAEAELYADCRSNVLIHGETGVGKERVARLLHEGHRRYGKGPFVAVNCGAFSESLVEAELFGHEKGAFTGALAAKAGWFEEANGGTLFLDEIGDLPMPIQVKLLRVLQEREVVRLGSRKSIPIDVRVLAATNVQLERAINAGHFREDLYYRLNVVSLELSPLRERPGDILPLTRHFIDAYSQRLGYGQVRLSAQAEHKLRTYGWPGNIRELENVIHHTLLICRDGLIEPPRVPLAVDPRGVGRSAPVDCLDDGALDLSSLRLALNGAEPVDPAAVAAELPRAGLATRALPVWEASQPASYSAHSAPRVLRSRERAAQSGAAPR